MLTRKVHGYVYVERTQMDGTVRQGLVGAVDLDAYDYAKGSQPAIRPSEHRRGAHPAAAESAPRGDAGNAHVMMLADDADRTLIEPIGLVKDQLPPLYDGELMLGGGRLRGWAVEDPRSLPKLIPRWRRWPTLPPLPAAGPLPKGGSRWYWPSATATTAWPPPKPIGRN